MNFEGIFPSYYRFRFREYLERTAPRRSRARNNEPAKPLIFANLLSPGDKPGLAGPQTAAIYGPQPFFNAAIDNPTEMTDQSQQNIVQPAREDITLRQTPSAPQGLGEMQHSAVREDRVEYAEPADAVPELQPRDAGWEAVSAYKFAIRTNDGPNVPRREQLENEVRQIKAEAKACPYCNGSGTCSVPYIRCGDRHQFAVRESTRQQSLPHQCLYRPQVDTGYVIIADNDPRVREFCKSALQIFSDIEEDRIITADSAQKAIDILNHFKILNKHAGLLLIDENMPGMNGFELVNELYFRNHAADIVLMHDPLTEVRKPRDYTGDMNITPRKRVVHATLLKPIHSDTLAETLNEIYYER